MATGGQKATYVAYRAGAALAVVLPEWLARPAVGPLGGVLSVAMRGRRAMLARHVRRVHGPGLSPRDVDRAVRETFSSYARYWLETFRLPRETPESLREGITTCGLEYLEAAAAGGRGMVMAAPHIGNWDLGGAWLAQAGYRPITVAEPIEPPELFDWFCSYRRRLGMEILSLADDNRGVLMRALQDGRLVGLICDRDLSGTGVEVEFFGERTTFPAGPATLALRAGVDILPGALYFDGPRRHRLVLRPPVPAARQGRLREDIARITQTLARECEVLVRRAPEQWHLLQPNWPSDFEALARAG